MEYKMALHDPIYYLYGNTLILSLWSIVLSVLVMLSPIFLAIFKPSI